MYRATVLCCAAVLVACAPSGERAGTEAAMISLADVAGVWTVQAFPATGDTALATYEMVATNSTEGWTVTFPGRDPLPARVAAVEGDSIVVDVGPYESVLRAGVMVSTRSVARLQDGNLRGTFAARYQTTQPDSVIRGRLQGTRKQQP